MYIPYNKKLSKNARILRNNSTPEENKLWYEYLSKISLRFLRQKPIDKYIVDFYCPKKRLVIEIDGSQHYSEKGVIRDKIRTETLKKYNITVIRFTNWEIKNRFIEVCEYIENIIKHTENKKRTPSQLTLTAPLLKGPIYGKEK